jgi:lysine-specific demethylase 3
MYNAMASSQEAGSKGTTRLHMDMADALNVMLYSSSCEDGSEGYAVWDLFRAEDSDKIRSFLKKRFGLVATPAPVNGPPEVEGGKAAAGKGTPATKPSIHSRHDPIHGQQFYLDVELRKALWEEYGVKSYRVYQRPGDGVFIPAGCAHQVRFFRFHFSPILELTIHPFDP